MRVASRYAVCEGREIHYTEWGGERADVVIAWHGLARTGRDMDDVAEHLAGRYRVICPDTIGRGLSEWSREPEREYCLAFYGRIAVSLLGQLGIGEADVGRRPGPRELRRGAGARTPRPSGGHRCHLRPVRRRGSAQDPRIGLKWTPILFPEDPLVARQ